MLQHRDDRHFGGARAPHGCRFCGYLAPSRMGCAPRLCFDPCRCATYRLQVPHACPRCGRCRRCGLRVRGPHARRWFTA